VTASALPVNRPAPAYPGSPRPLPRVFRAPGFWRQETSIIDALSCGYGHLRIGELSGAYGWVIRNSQRAHLEALKISTLGEFIELFRAGVPDELPYLMHLPVHRSLPAIRDGIRIPEAFRPNWVESSRLGRIGGPELFIGRQGAGFGPLHIDHVAVRVGFYQFLGSKEVLLLPPEDGRYLYRYPGHEFPYQLRNSRISGFGDIDLEAFPLFRHAGPLCVTLHAGHALFLPVNWWHTTLNLTDSVSYSIRIVNRTNALRCAGEHLLGVPRLLRRLAG